MAWSNGIGRSKSWNRVLPSASGTLNCEISHFAFGDASTDASVTPSFRRIFFPFLQTVRLWRNGSVWFCLLNLLIRSHNQNASNAQWLPNMTPYLERNLLFKLASDKWCAKSQWHFCQQAIWACLIVKNNNFSRKIKLFTQVWHPTYYKHS